MADQDIVLRGPSNADDVILSSAAALNIWINVSGSWKQVSEVYVNVSGTWKLVSEVDVNASGTWKVV